MKTYLSLLATGALLWALAFGLSVVIFPLKAANAPLFHNILVVAMGAIGGVLTLLRFRSASSGYARYGLMLGFVWLGVNLGLDLIVFLGSFGFTLHQYVSEIGSAYPLILLQPWLMGLAADRAHRV